jgi:hypothetical protein
MGETQLSRIYQLYRGGQFYLMVEETGCTRCKPPTCAGVESYNLRVQGDLLKNEIFSHLLSVFGEDLQTQLTSTLFWTNACGSIL